MSCPAFWPLAKNSNRSSEGASFLKKISHRTEPRLHRSLLILNFVLMFIKRAIDYFGNQGVMKLDMSVFFLPPSRQKLDVVIRKLTDEENM